MSRRAMARKVVARRHLDILVDLRDELAEAKNLATAAYMACHALSVTGSERPALCAMTTITRDRLELALGRLDRLIAAFD